MKKQQGNPVLFLIVLQEGISPCSFFFKGDREPVLAVIINRHDFELLKNNRSLTGAVAL
ncbi:hypothetical protein [Cytobacillus pseudoceanisediminis]|uniref:hypothetical protein n=1 Tax=Cytobacillus pseudoceanisediminis TaxID=3051614 RepID=UPI003CF7C6B8